jgi:hypothetical protein
MGGRCALGDIQIGRVATMNGQQQRAVREARDAVRPVTIAAPLLGGTLSSMRGWVAVVVVVAAVSLAVVLWPRALDWPARERDGPAVNAARPASSEQERPSVVPGPENGTRRDAGPGVDESEPGGASSLGRDVADGLRTAMSQRSLAVLLRRANQVEMEYHRWFDAGLGPDQVDVEVLPNGLIVTRVTNERFDDEPIAPGVLTDWELFKRDPQASIAISDMRELTRERVNECMRAFAAKHGEMPHEWRFQYVWRAQSLDGRGRVATEVDAAWWPASFDEADRRCYRAALDEIEKLEFITDTHDFKYRMEVADYLPVEEP